MAEITKEQQAALERVRRSEITIATEFDKQLGRDVREVLQLALADHLPDDGAEISIEALQRDGFKMQNELRGWEIESVNICGEYTGISVHDRGVWVVRACKEAANMTLYTRVTTMGQIRRARKLLSALTGEPQGR